MVATLVLMVAGRGVAQLITDGQIITFDNPGLVFLCNGHALFLPFSVWIVVAMYVIAGLLTRKTAFGLFIESVGNNERASRYAGIEARRIKWLTYVICGFCAGVAGLLAASNIKCADSNNAGLNLELDAILAPVIGGTSMAGGRFFLSGSLVGAILIQTLTTTMYMKNVSPAIVAVPKAMVVIIVGFSALLSWILSATGIPAQIAAKVVPILGNKYVYWLVLLVILFVIGCLMETVASMLILGPILVPIGIALGIDKLHLAVVFCIALIVGMVTPPFGLNLFTSCATTGRTFTQVVHGMIPYLIAIMVVVIIIAFVPGIALALPNAVGLVW